MHPRIDERCNRDFQTIAWLAERRHEFNHAMFVVFTSLAFPVMALATTLCIVSLADDTPNDVELVPAVLSLTLFVVGPIAAVIAYAWLSPRVVAQSPAECWAA